MDLTPLTDRAITYWIALSGAVLFVASRQNTIGQRIVSGGIAATLAIGLTETVSEYTGFSEVASAVAICVFGQVILETIYSVVADRELMKETLMKWLSNRGAGK